MQICFSKVSLATFPTVITRFSLRHTIQSVKVTGLKVIRFTNCAITTFLSMQIVIGHCATLDEICIFRLQSGKSLEVHSKCERFEILTANCAMVKCFWANFVESVGLYGGQLSIPKLRNFHLIIDFTTSPCLDLTSFCATELSKMVLIVLNCRREAPLIAIYIIKEARICESQLTIKSSRIVEQFLNPVAKCSSGLAMH